MDADEEYAPPRVRNPFILFPLQYSQFGTEELLVKLAHVYIFPEHFFCAPTDAKGRSRGIATGRVCEILRQNARRDFFSYCEAEPVSRRRTTSDSGWLRRMPMVLPSGEYSNQLISSAVKFVI